MEAVIHIFEHCKHLTILTFAWLLTSLLKGRISSALIVIVWVSKKQTYDLTTQEQEILFPCMMKMMNETHKIKANICCDYTGSTVWMTPVSHS